MINKEVKYPESATDGKNEWCPAKDNELHCDHWWDGDGCCWCGAPPMSIEEQIELGMIEEVDNGC